MTTAAEYAELAAIEANSAQTAAVDVQNQVAVAESSANAAAYDAYRVAMDVNDAEDAKNSSQVHSITSKNHKEQADLWANADPNVLLAPGKYSARHYAALTGSGLGALSTDLGTLQDNTAAQQVIVDNALAIIAGRLNTGDVNFDLSNINADILLLQQGYNTVLSTTLLLAQYNTDTLGLADFAKSSQISIDNKISAYLDEAGQTTLQSMLSGATNATKLSYAGIVVDPDTGTITNAAGSAISTEYGARLAAVESIMDGQGKYTVTVQQQLNDSIATVQQAMESSVDVVAKSVTDLTGHLTDGTFAINLSLATVDGSDSIQTYVTAQTDSLVVVYSGEDHTTQTGMSNGDIYIEKTTASTAAGGSVDVINTYKYDTDWTVIGNNANTVALADLVDGKRAIYNNAADDEPSGDLNDLWIPTDPITLPYEGSIIPKEVYSSNGTDWEVATKFTSDIGAVDERVTSVSTKYSVKVDAAGHVAGFGLISTSNDDNVVANGFSEFTIAADSFKVGGVDPDGVAHTSVPFRVITGSGICVLSTGIEEGNKTKEECTTLDPAGVWLAPGTWMKDAYMEAASISGLLTLEGTINNSLIVLSPSDVGAVSTIEYNANNQTSGSVSLNVAGTGLTKLGNNLIKAAGGTQWTMGAYSSQSYTGGAVTGCIIASGGTGAIRFMFGLNSDPATNSSYSSIDYAIYANNGSYSCYESGISKGVLLSAAPAVGDMLAVEYDGLSVRYYINGTEYKTTPATTGLKLHMDSSFTSTVVNLKNIAFQSMSDLNVPLVDAYNRAEEIKDSIYFVDGVTGLRTVTIDGGNISAGTVDADQIHANAITSAKIDAGAITTAKIDAGAITAVKIAAGAITATSLTITGPTSVASVLTPSLLGAPTIAQNNTAATTANWSTVTDNDGNMPASNATANQTDAAALTAVRNDGLVRSNLLKVEEWTEGRSSWSDEFSVYGGASTNVISSVTGPEGIPVLAWKATTTTNQAPSGDWSGGFIHNLAESANRFNHSNAHRFVCWVKLSSISYNFYMGYGSNDVSALNSTTVNTNPYSFSNNKPPTANKWYLMVAVTHGSGSTATSASGVSGWYDPVTGTKVKSASSEYKFLATSTNNTIRMAMYRNPVGITAEYYAPRWDVLDGSQPSVVSILNSATVGATWGTNLGGQPTDTELLNTNTTASDIGYTGDLDANNITNTNDLTDGANLGGTAVWANVTGTSGIETKLGSAQKVSDFSDTVFASNNTAPFRVVTGGGVCVVGGVDNTSLSQSQCNNTSGGVWLGNGTWINSAFIADATIDAAKIRNLQVDELAVNSLIASAIDVAELTADNIKVGTLTGVAIAATTITGGTITGGSIIGGVIQGAIIATSAYAASTDYGSNYYAYSVGVSGTASSTTSGGSVAGVNQLIKPYNYYVNSLDSIVSSNSNQWRYRRLNVTPTITGTVKVTSQSNSYYDGNRNVICGYVRLSVYSASSGGTLIAQKAFQIKVVAKNPSGTRTQTYSAGGCSFSLSYGLTYWSTSDGWSSWFHNRINTNDITYSITCDLPFNDNNSTGIYTTVDYYSVGNGLALGNKHITTTDTADNDY